MGSDPGKPKDALDELLRIATKPVGTPVPDPDVPLAFAAGWHAAEAVAAAGSGPPERVELACTQVRADAARLNKPLQAAGQDAAALDQAIKALTAAPADGAAAKTLSATFGEQLLAADFKLGKAFNLGSEIAGLFALSSFSAAEFRKELLERHDTLHDWLSQLASALPPNAGHSVKDSLGMWGQALEPEDETRLSDLTQDERTRQGERWRSLLSGEKAGKDALELTDYVGVAEGMTRQIRVLALRALRDMWRYGLIVAAFAALGVAGVVIWQHSAGSAAGIASLLTAVGLTWKGIGGSLGRAIARVEQPAWDAQVDRAIAYAISSPLPGKLIDDAPPDTLLHGLGEWRKSHARPLDQGRRRSAPG